MCAMVAHAFVWWCSMEIYKINGIDCREKRNRILLAKDTARAIKVSKKPDIALLERWYKSLSKKYKMKANIFKISKRHISLNINVIGDSYSVFECRSYYECLCKYILFVEQWRKYNVN